MKKSILFSTVIILLGINSIICQEKNFNKNSFKVSGNCEMCKSKIEKAANSIEGVKSSLSLVRESVQKGDFDKQLEKRSKVIRSNFKWVQTS